MVVEDACPTARCTAFTDLRINGAPRFALAGVDQVIASLYLA